MTVSYLQKKFHQHVVPKGQDDCWLWTGAQDGKGYGRIKIYLGGGRLAARHERHLAHRVAYALANGPISSLECVLHRCDTPLCCNPRHLFLGTRGENNLDRDAKSRQARGEGHGRAKLTAQQVLAIRSDARPHRKLAREYGLARSTICAIKHRRLWREVEHYG